MNLQEYFLKELRHRQNENLKNSVLAFGCNQWFNLRVSLLNILLVQLPCYSYMLWVLTNEADPVSIAMVVIYTGNITQDAINFLTMISDLETSFVSVERCVNFQQIEPEGNYYNFHAEEKTMISLTTDLKKLKPATYAPALKMDNYKIIKHGKIEFKNVFAKYPLKKDYV